jgi:hypothetical protein
MISLKTQDECELEAQETIAEWLEEFYENYYSREVKDGEQRS